MSPGNLHEEISIHDNAQRSMRKLKRLAEIDDIAFKEKKEKYFSPQFDQVLTRNRC